jgi:hypothetical protein
MIRVKPGLMQSEIAPPQTKDVFVVPTIFTLKLYTPFPFSSSPSCPNSSRPVFQVIFHGTGLILLFVLTMNS